MHLKSAEQDRSPRVFTNSHVLNLAPASWYNSNLYSNGLTFKGLNTFD